MTPVPIYSHPNPTKAMESALHGALLALGRAEGHLDSLNRPIIVDGFRYDGNVMALVGHVTDHGGIQYQDRSTHARTLADTLGYTTTANLVACVREAVTQGLLSATVRDNDGWLMMTDYGLEQLDMWEEYNEQT